jgi:hypothetical protein
MEILPIPAATAPETARLAAISLSAAFQETNPISSLLLDILMAFALHGPERLFTRTILQRLTSLTDRPWAELCHGKQINELWLSRQVKPYGVKPRTIWIGEAQAKG